VDELRTTRASYGFIHEVIRQGLVPAMIDDMLDGLVRLMADQSAGEIENLRTFTKAYQAAVDTGARSTIAVDYDFPVWMHENFGADLAQYRLDEPATLTLQRARGRLPNANLESVDASICSQQQFTEWLYFIRNTRDYVDILNTESEAA
jgi:hypothetical protein